MTVQAKFKLKSIALERAKLNRAIERGQKRAVMKSLAYVRTKARTRVLRRRKKVSQPGQPPNLHARGRISLRTIFFNYNPARRSGFVGPIKMEPQNPAKPSTTVPNVLEFGGVVYYQQAEIKPGEWVEVGRRRLANLRRNRASVKVRRRRKVIKARPFMSVALEQVNADDGILTPWANVVSD